MELKVETTSSHPVEGTEDGRAVVAWARVDEPANGVETLTRRLVGCGERWRSRKDNKEQSNDDRKPVNTNQGNVSTRKSQLAASVS